MRSRRSDASAFAQLASTLDGNVVLPGDAAYDEAIRGGGGNFGIVTSFEYRLVRLDSVLSGLLYFPVSRAAEVIRVYRDLMVDAPDELQTAGGLMGTPHGPALMVSICYCGVLAKGERIADR